MLNPILVDGKGFILAPQNNPVNTCRGCSFDSGPMSCTQMLNDDVDCSRGDTHQIYIPEVDPDD